MDRREFDAGVNALRERYADQFTNCLGNEIIDYAPGWLDLIATALKQADDAQADHGKWEVHQVKEKFGRLRIYGTFPGQIAIDAENRSANTCMCWLDIVISP